MSNFAVVIGAGPAGLMAADKLASNGVKVLIVDRKPSFGRKFLMAGKSGLNLTKNENLEDFVSQFYEASDWMNPILRNFGPDAVSRWANELNQNVFIGSSGRVFPTSMKASPLLRSWLKKLQNMNVKFETKWNWVGWKDNKLCFQTESGLIKIQPVVTILSLGGGSWKKLGSNGLWVKIMKDENILVNSLEPANVRLKVYWSDKMLPHYGKPLKNIILKAGGLWTRGEAIISKRGLEGSAVYTVSKSAREGCNVFLDLLPDFSHNAIIKKLRQRNKKVSFSKFLQKSFKLDEAKRAIFFEFSHPLPNDDKSLANLLKAVKVIYSGLGNLDEAISSSGGVSKKSFDDGLMLYEKPGVFVAGEMLDWEAPTGGYLINGCLATGFWAGLNASEWVKNKLISPSRHQR